MSDPWWPRVLVADDEEIQRNIMQEILISAGHEVATAGSVDEGLRLFRESQQSGEPIDLILTDLKMPGKTEGLDLLREVKEIELGVEVILMTAYSEVRSAVRAMKLGAFEYLPKPFDKERLLHVVGQATEKLKLVRENRRLRQLVDTEEGVGRMVGRSAAMRELFDLIGRVARTSSTCLICGESGTGKELVARAIHQHGPRAEQPFLAINCAAIPETLIESELFGHEKGVFTGAFTAKSGRFEEVGDGTLFLDEVGSMRIDLQAKLLRVIQEREFSRVGSSELIPFSGRIVAATAQDLEAGIMDGSFREDLYFRLNVVTLEIPPLRRRKDDIPVLVEHFLRRCGERVGRTVRGVTPRVLELFEEYHWPGNVRELENCIERMLVVGDGDYLDPTQLPPAVRDNRGEIAFTPGSVPSPTNGMIRLPSGGIVLEEMEAELIRQALDRSAGRIEPAAQLLGITYKTLQYRIKKYDLKTRQDEARKASE